MAEGNQFRREFLATFLPLALLLTVAVYFIGHTLINQDISRIASDDVRRVGLGTATLTAALKTPLLHLRSLQTERPIRAAIADQSADRLAAMSEAFSSLLQRNPAYDQARWIDEKGLERVRVDRSQDGTAVVAVAGADLQDKSGRDYFTDTIMLGIGEIFVSRLDLNIDNGKISIPYKPTFRFVTAVADSTGARRGILVINVLAAPMLADFIRITGEPDRHVVLLNGQGYWGADKNSA